LWQNSNQNQILFLDFWAFGHKNEWRQSPVSIIDNYHLPHHTLAKQPGVHIGNHSILKKKSNEQEN
jgi:hypothetical protein